MQSCKNPDQYQLSKNLTMQRNFLHNYLSKSQFNFPKLIIMLLTRGCAGIIVHEQKIAGDPTRKFSDMFQRREA